ncbi:MAG: YceI family protein [Candidatus Zixiibacteriota bacterium]
MNFFKKVFPLILTASSILAADFGVGPLNESDTIYFSSSAKLEFIEGATQHINGSFSLDPDNTGSGLKGLLRVDLRTLKTGIEKRDEHMLDNHLQTDKYPYAFFELVSVKDLPSQFFFDSTYILNATGNFYIHGGYREMDAVLQVVRRKLPAAGDEIDIIARFVIKLDDYKISRPKALFLKLAETIEVKAIFTGSTQTPVKVVVLPDWPKLD